ncbi:MAG: hypothetical protein JWR40_1221 [Massilia sp.]|jgi:hypothetical protein|nr:hypothetical protein [Massilia sp.]MDB5948999.1 hypothetical protein [Massilia sp.]
MSGTSTLDPDNFPETPDRSLGTGHGTDALGPSDTSDTGSDVVGGPGFALGIDDDQMPDLDRGTTEDYETGSGTDSAGADMGDSDLDSDSDSGGTGERAAVGRDTKVRDGADIDTDSIQSFEDVPLTDDDIDFLESSPPGSDKDEGKGRGKA